MDHNQEEILDYLRTKEKLLSFLDNNENAIMTLATSANNIVMARPVLIISNYLDIYFFTWKHSRKCTQIKENDLISLSKDKVEIEGTAEILGLMFEEKNKEVLEILKKKQPEAIKRWEDKPNMVIARVKPLFACLDGYFINGVAYIEYIDLRKEYSYRLKWAYY